MKDFAESLLRVFDGIGRGSEQLLGNINGEAFLIHQIVIKTGETVIHNKVILAVATFGVTTLGVYVWRILRTKLFSR